MIPLRDGFSIPLDLQGFSVRLAGLLQGEFIACRIPFHTFHSRDRYRYIIIVRVLERSKAVYSPEMSVPHPANLAPASLFAVDLIDSDPQRARGGKWAQQEVSDIDLRCHTRSPYLPSPKPRTHAATKQ